MTPTALDLALDLMSAKHPDNPNAPASMIQAGCAAPLAKALWDLGWRRQTTTSAPGVAEPVESAEVRPSPMRRLSRMGARMTDTTSVTLSPGSLPSQVVEAVGVEMADRLNATAPRTDILDGLHHAWCKNCRPDWAARPLGAELGVPFTAWCGKRAVILAIWQSDSTPPGTLCPTCWATPPPPCATCGGI